MRHISDIVKEIVGGLEKKKLGHNAEIEDNSVKKLVSGLKIGGKV